MTDRGIGRARACAPPIVAITIGLALAPRAAAAGAAEDGEALAERLCAGCHGVVAGAASPHASAPPFEEIAGRYPPEALSESFAEGVTVGHPDMPEFALKAEEIEALVAYFESLRAAR